MSKNRRGPIFYAISLILKVDQKQVFKNKDMFLMLIFWLGFVNKGKKSPAGIILS